MKLPRTRVAVIDVVALSRQMMEHMPRLSAWAEGRRVSSFPPAFPALTCSAQDGSLTVTDSDGSTQSGTYTLTQHDANDVLYDLTLDSETGTALVGVTEYTDAAGEKSSEYTLILSLPERTVYFRADMAQ